MFSSLVAAEVGVEHLLTVREAVVEQQPCRLPLEEAGVLVEHQLKIKQKKHSWKRNGIVRFNTLAREMPIVTGFIQL